VFLIAPPPLKLMQQNPAFSLSGWAEEGVAVGVRGASYAATRLSSHKNTMEDVFLFSYITCSL